MAEYYKQRHLTPKETDEAILSGIMLTGTLIGLGFLLNDIRKNGTGTNGVGRADSVPLEIPFEYDSIIDFSKRPQETRRSELQARSRNELSEEIDRAFENMRNSRGRYIYNYPQTILDENSGIEYDVNTVIEVWGYNRIGHAKRKILEISGDMLRNVAMWVYEANRTAELMGYDVAYFGNGEEVFWNDYDLAFEFPVEDE